VIILLGMQAIAFLVLIVRLLPGRTRRPPLEPRLVDNDDTTVSVIVATLNEAARLAPCLAGLAAQKRPLREIIIVDSNSTDGTRDLVRDAAQRDPRIRLLTDPPLPAGWVGKQWALQYGLEHARGEWILGLDADTEPNPGLVGAVVEAAREGNYALISFAPMFADQTSAEQFLQPALLRTLIYRGGAVGTESDPERVLANGQCFLVRRDVLLRQGGYAVAKRSFADDVTLARHIARSGERVGFLDGSRLFRVRAYRSAGEMWREWGRSLDLSDATSSFRRWSDAVLLTLVQGLPLPCVTVLAIRAVMVGLSSIGQELLALNLAMIAVSALLLLPVAKSYERPTVAYWLSWLADPLAALRIIISMVDRRRTWRGRKYLGFAVDRLSIESTASTAIH
jgi:dolichol-phosphate mannosyltransferase